MKLTIEKITPKIAAEYLKRVSDQKQRKLMPAVVKSYASIMRAGDWKRTHQGIAFDDQKNLIDGQHRLGAIVESGITVELPVAYDLPSKGDEALNAIDSGRTRKVGDHLTMQYGYRGNGNIMAAATRAIQTICWPSRSAHTIQVALKIIDIYGQELNDCWKNISEIRGLKLGAVMGSSAFAAKGMTKTKFKEFYRGLMTGENLEEGNPALALRNHLLENTIGRQGGGSGLIAKASQIVCLAAMHFQAGTSLRAFRKTSMGVDFFIDRQKETVVAVRKAMGLETEKLEILPKEEEAA